MEALGPQASWDGPRGGFAPAATSSREMVLHVQGQEQEEDLVSGCQGNLGDGAEWEDGPRALAP